MEETARVFTCARCHCPVVVCSRCDRGQSYCGRACATAARARSLRAAGRRYQATRRGRFTHAARQRRYRTGLAAKKVTHQGSLSPGLGDLLLCTANEPLPTGAAQVRAPSEGRVCRFCGRVVRAELRADPPRLVSPRHASRRPWAARPRGG
jgi:hypothetical protein